MNNIIITAGFPCQDISIAGKQKGITGERSGLFDEIIRIARILRPRVLFLENVPNLLSGENGGWMRHVIGSITEIGYDCEWEVISAAEVGAWHKRERVWIVGYNNSINVDKVREIPKGESIKSCGNSKDSTEGSGIKGTIRESSTSRDEFNNSSEVCNTIDSQTTRYREDSRNIPEIAESERFNNCSKRWWAVEPQLGRVADGIPNRMDRLKCIGNAVVPQCVAEVGKMILQSGIIENPVTLLDLFSGIGGFHLGLKMAGFEFEKVYYSDIDEYANKIYQLRFPDAIPLGDITKIKE